MIITYLEWLKKIVDFACFSLSPRRVLGRRGGLTVTALVFGSSGPGSSPDRGHCVVFLGKTLNSHRVTVPLSTQVYAMD